MNYETISFRGLDYYLVPVDERQDNRKVAVIAGHTTSNKGDWSNIFKAYEHDYWNAFIRNYLPSWIKTFEHIPDATYTERQKAMAELTKDFDLVIELHWNAFDPDNDGKDDAHGVECFTWKGNEKTKLLGEFYTAQMHVAFDLFDRGCKPIDHGNGAGFLNYTKGDAILLEPFFADNEDDVLEFDMDTYAHVIENTIDSYYGT